MLVRIFPALFLLCSSFSLFAEEYWIDVRIPAEFTTEHIDGAVNLPLSQLVTSIADVVKNRDDVVHLYCNSGNQSHRASILLKRYGYTNLIDEGGIQNAKASILAKQETPP